MVRWNAKTDWKLLCELFDSGVADPRFTKATDIDPIKEMKDNFKKYEAVQFRNNYKTTAVNWMAGKALEGTRRASLDRESNSVNTH